MKYKVIAIPPDGEMRTIAADGVALLSFEQGGGGSVLIGGEITDTELLRGTHQMMDEYLRANALSSLAATVEAAPAPEPPAELPKPEQETVVEQVPLAPKKTTGRKGQ